MTPKRAEAIFLLVAIFSAVVIATFAQQPNIERGPTTQFWHLRTFPTKNGGSVLIFKIQVGKQMVCKAVYIDREREKAVESNTNDDTVAIGLSLTSASLGDVPCE